MGQNSSTDGLLEIRFSRLGDRYQILLVFQQGRKKTAEIGIAKLDTDSLAELRGQPQAYGEKLAEGVFFSERVRSFFESAKAAAGGTLRVALTIDPSAPELHAVAWELLTDGAKAPVASNENTPFSRFLFGDDWKDTPLLEKRQLKALIAVASPANLRDDWGLAPIDAAREIQSIQAALSGAGVSVDVMHGPVTIDGLMEKIRDGADILYLVCHGTLLDPENRTRAVDFEAGFGEEMNEARTRGIRVPGLLLDKLSSPGRAGLVSGGELARRIGNLRRVPQLMVLASCESAGVEEDQTGYAAQASLAPRLCRAGVPAVVAMQGKISWTTASKFMRIFFEQLVRTGSIDRAAAVARSSVWFESPHDCWMPALFLRIPDGMLWYEPAFLPDAEIDLDTIAVEVASGNCTPIVGWGVGEDYFGTKLEFSRNLAMELEASQGLPFPPSRRGELPLVSQYLRLTNRSNLATIEAFQKFLKAQVLKNSHLDKDLSRESTASVLEAAWRAGSADGRLEPYRVIARFPARVFVNACQDGILEAALREAGKTPTVRTIEWKGTNERAEAERLNPSIESPLLLHVFGHFRDPNSVVLWEDDYLDFLMGIAQHQKLIPNVVKDALTDQTLLFLGFNVTDWSFRVLFRMVKRLMRGGGGDGLPNTAVQVEPDGTLFAGAKEAQDYLQKFYKTSNIEPYWGTSRDFLAALQPKLEERGL